MTIEQHTGGSTLALTSDQEYWNDRQLAALRQLGVDRAAPADLAVFFHVAQRTGLDVFARQLYLVYRDGKQVIQTGIDGYRLVAQRAANRDRVAYGISAPQWCDSQGRWWDVWLAEDYPAAARVTVTRAGEAFPAVAMWREYVQTTRDRQSGQTRVTRMWHTRAAGQLAKCAEALALRKAFPQDLSGMYVDAELDRTDVVRGEVTGGGLASVRRVDFDQQPEPEAPQTGEEGGPVSREETSTDPSSPPPRQPEPDDRPPVAPVMLNTSSKLAKAMYAAIRGAGIPQDRVHDLMSEVTGRDITSSKELTEDDAHRIMDFLPDQQEAES